MKKNTKTLLIVAIVVLAGLYLTGNLKAVIYPTGSAATVCNAGVSSTTCGVSNYLGLGCGSDPLSQICIDGIRVSGLDTFFNMKNVKYDRCSFRCTGSGYNSINFDTGLIEGTIGTDGCYASVMQSTAYNGGNAFSVSCTANFYTATTTVTVAQKTCNTDGVCNTNEDITCVDCQGSTPVTSEQPAIPDDPIIITQGVTQNTVTPAPTLEPGATPTPTPDVTPTPTPSGVSNACLCSFGQHCDNDICVWDITNVPASPQSTTQIGTVTISNDYTIIIVLLLAVVIIFWRNRRNK